MRRACAIAIVVFAACGTNPPAGSTEPTPARKSETVRAVQRGLASWYGGKFHGRKTASGERFDKRKLTAASRTIKFGTRVRVTNRKNGKSVIVRINDRGPFGKRKRILDVSEAAAERLDMKRAGVVPVVVEVLD